MRAMLVLSALLSMADVVGAQRVTDTTSREAPMSSVTGKVVTPNAAKEIPIPGIYVTLHRVATDSSGPVDSVRTNAQGEYVIRYRRPREDQGVYFAAAVYRGIAYFSAPIQSARAQGEEAEITVFDTTSKPIDFHVRGHHVVVSAPRPEGSRDVVEVWELSNDTTATAVGKDTLSPVWTTALPSGASNLRAGQGDVGPGAIVERENRVALIAPFGPGVKQISYSYSLPASRFPLRVVIDKPTSVLEVLLEEPLAQASGGTLRATDAATTSGRTFKRFLGQDVSPGEAVRITVPTTSATTRTRVLATVAALIALIMAGALARALTGRGAQSRHSLAPAPSEVEQLVAAIAALDARSERGDPTLDSDAYAADRAALKARLEDTLAPGARVV
ncbi:MAG: hypothetical protein ABJE10_17465 [bacterium]